MACYCCLNTLLYIFRETTVVRWREESFFEKKFFFLFLFVLLKTEITYFKKIT